MAYNFEMRLNNAIKRLHYLGSADEKPKRKWDEEVGNALSPAMDNLRQKPVDKNAEAKKWLQEQKGFRANMGASDKTVDPKAWQRTDARSDDASVRAQDDNLKLSAVNAQRNAQANAQYQMTPSANGETTKDAQASAANQAQLQAEDEKKAKAMLGMGGAPMVGRF